MDLRRGESNIGRGGGTELGHCPLDEGLVIANTVPMRRNTSGFTIIELIVVIMIGSILTGVALSSFREAQTRFAVNGAKQVYMSWHQRARSKAIETGETVIMWVNLTGDSAALLERDGSTYTWGDVQHFGTELNVDLRHPYYGAFYLCMTPRGFADRGCGYWGATYGISGGIPDTVRLEFWLAGDSTSVLLLPMGQVIG